ncbi:MAG TPA: sugar phosphate isomerase/epimerase [Bryobacteraceae bacterium]|nr:sugar phosphate isomerase/epimerase [Bryobacteraceae bacterium]
MKHELDLSQRTRSSRREFLARGAQGVAALGCLAGGLRAEPFGIPAGFQTYPIAKEFVADVDGALRQLAAIGYRVAETCSPPGYAQFKPLMSLTPAELRKKFNAAGIVCESCHYGFRELQENLPDRIAYARELGLKQMIIASFGLPKDATLADWRKAADDSNKLGAETLKAGIQLGFHNHGMELVELEGVLIFDELIRTFDPALVKMQCQIVNVAGAGMDPVSFIKKYPGRFLSLHLADRSSEGKQAPVGKGTIDWKGVFTAMRAAGMQNYYVEMNMDALRESYPYLHSLRL